MSSGDLALIGVAVTLILGILAFMTNRRANRTNEKKVEAEQRQGDLGVNLELNKYIDERVERLVAARIGGLQKQIADADERDRSRTSAFIRILRAIAAQWPPGDSGPNLDPADIRAVEDTIPRQWIRKGRGSEANLAPRSP